MASLKETMGSGNPENDGAGQEANAGTAASGNRNAGAGNGSQGERVFQGVLLCADTETITDPRFDNGDPEAAPSLSKPGLQKIVALAGLAANVYTVDGYEELHILGSGCFGDAAQPEHVALRAFWNTIDNKQPKLVTWGGRRFDVQNWQIRSQIYGLSGGYWCSGGNKFENYHHRYAEGWHTDLMDVMSGQGAVAPMKQDEAARLFGFPGKGDTEGADVRKLVEENRIDDTRRYCELDVLDLFGLYCRHALFQGRMSPETYDRSIQNFQRYLEKKAQNEENSHIAGYLERWQKVEAPLTGTISGKKPAPLPENPSWYRGAQAAPTANGATATAEQAETPATSSKSQGAGGNEPDPAPAASSTGSSPSSDANGSTASASAAPSDQTPRKETTAQSPSGNGHDNKAAPASTEATAGQDQGRDASPRSSQGAGTSAGSNQPAPDGERFSINDVTDDPSTDPSKSAETKPSTSSSTGATTPSGSGGQTQGDKTAAKPASADEKNGASASTSQQKTASGSASTATNGGQKAQGTTAGSSQQTAKEKPRKKAPPKPTLGMGM